MTKWIQETLVAYTDGRTKVYGKKERTADEMVRLLAQLSLLRQAGENIILDCDTDENYEVTVYRFFRKLKDRSVENIFTKVN